MMGLRWAAAKGTWKNGRIIPLARGMGRQTQRNEIHEGIRHECCRHDRYQCWCRSGPQPSVIEFATGIHGLKERAPLEQVRVVLSAFYMSAWRMFG